jgi:hypothetical protein
LNRGVGKLNRETNLLADNPLVHEISLIVAKQLLTKSKEDPEQLNQLLTYEQREQLAILKNQIQQKENIQMN